MILIDLRIPEGMGAPFPYPPPTYNPNGPPPRFDQAPPNAAMMRGPPPTSTAGFSPMRPQLPPNMAQMQQPPPRRESMDGPPPRGDQGQDGLMGAPPTSQPPAMHSQPPPVHNQPPPAFGMPPPSMGMPPRGPPMAMAGSPGVRPQMPPNMVRSTSME